jgi:hypothetical protein
MALRLGGLQTARFRAATTTTTRGRSPDQATDTVHHTMKAFLASLFNRAEMLRMPQRLHPGTLAWLLAIDAALIAVHIALRLAGRDIPLFNISLDQSMGEFFEYAKEAFIAGLLGVLAYQRRDIVLACWSGLFAYLLADDALELHEQIAPWLAALAWPGGGEKSVILAEFMFLMTFAAIAAGITLTLVLRHRLRLDTVHRDLLLLFCALAAFGVVLDLVHGLVGLFIVPRIFGLIEDGGEMVVMSMLCARAAFEMVRGRPRA